MALRFLFARSAPVLTFALCLLPSACSESSSQSAVSADGSVEAQAPEAGSEGGVLPDASQTDAAPSADADDASFDAPVPSDGALQQDVQPQDAPMEEAEASSPDADSADATDGAESFEPEPIPSVSDEPPAPCPEALSNPELFQFLDDVCHEKRFPSNKDRDWSCPVADSSPSVTLATGQTVTYQPGSEEPVFDETALQGIVPDALNITVILIKRVGGVPYYRYVSNGTQEVAYQPWSSTKFLAAANAGARLRLASAGAVGLTASVDGYALGDLITSIHTYDESPFSSNALGRYFHNIGGRDRANNLIHSLWLGRPADETFGGNYGELEPSLSYQFVEPSGASLTLSPDLSHGPANHLSSHTMAEVLKRLALHREEPSQQLPGLTWTDLQVLFYGAQNSAHYEFWGGMSADTSIYIQSGQDIDYLERRSHGTWRIFSKLGAGSAGQYTHVGYGCFPVLDAQERPVMGWGREFVMAAQLQDVGSSWRERDRLLATYYRAIISRIIDGRL